MWTKWRKTTRQEKRTKWWKLREKEIQIQFREKVLESGIMESKGGYEAVANGIRDTDQKVVRQLERRHHTTKWQLVWQQDGPAECAVPQYQEETRDKRSWPHP